MVARSDGTLIEGVDVPGIELHCINTVDLKGNLSRLTSSDADGAVRIWSAGDGTYMGMRKEKECIEAYTLGISHRSFVTTSKSENARISP